MIKVLVVEDNPVKASKVSEFLNSLAGCKVEIVSDIVNARSYLQRYFNLLIIDVNLPERFGEVPKKENGLEFISEIKKSSRLKKPDHIIGLTEYAAIIDLYKYQFEKDLLSLVYYDEKNADWEYSIKSKIEYLILSEVERRSVVDYDFDYAIIAALRDPEFEALLKLDYGWSLIKVPNDSSSYYIGKFRTINGEIKNIVATYLPQMGMVAASTSVLKIMNAFRARFVIMVGICAGIKGKVNLGDLIVCESSFDFGSGKYLCDEKGVEKFLPDFKQLPLNSEYKETLMDLSMDQNLIRSIKDRWQGDIAKNEIQMHIGPLASGSAVISTSTKIQDLISHQRKTLGIDMETYGVFYACEYVFKPKPTAMSIKAVSDFADKDKNDSYQKFCSFLSVSIVDYIMKNIL